MSSIDAPAISNDGTPWSVCKSHIFVKFCISQRYCSTYTQSFFLKSDHCRDHTSRCDSSADKPVMKSKFHDHDILSMWDVVIIRCADYLSYSEKIHKLHRRSWWNGLSIETVSTCVSCTAVRLALKKIQIPEMLPLPQWHWCLLGSPSKFQASKHHILALSNHMTYSRDPHR